MPRPKRKKIKFDDEDSLNDLLQEIYDDSHNIRSQIRRLFTKWEAKVKEGGEIQAIGDQIIKLINAASKNQDQKIMLLKYLKEVVFEKNKKSSNDNDDNASSEMTKERRSALINLVQDELSKEEKSNNN
jgi:hypothetical protein